MSLIDEVKRFWEREGKLFDGRLAYVKSFRSAVDADTCVSELVETGVGRHVQIEQSITDIGFTAIRLDSEQFDNTYG